MKRFALIAVALFGAATFSAHDAIASRWHSELATMSLAPGALAPTFAPICSAGNADDNEHEEGDCGADVIADWMTAAFHAMSLDELQQLISDYGGDLEVEYSLEELVEMDYDSLVETLKAADPVVMAELCKAKAKRVPCKTKKAPPGSCVYGRPCAGGGCKDNKGKAGKCISRVNRTQNPLFIGCLNFTKTDHWCDDKCAGSLPAWTLLMGAMGSISVLRRRRKSSEKK